MYHLLGYYLGHLEIDLQYDTKKEANEKKYNMLFVKHQGWKFKIVYQQGG